MLICFGEFFNEFRVQFVLIPVSIVPLRLSKSSFFASEWKIDYYFETKGQSIVIRFVPYRDHLYSIECINCNRSIYTTIFVFIWVKLIWIYLQKILGRSSVASSGVCAVQSCELCELVCFHVQKARCLQFS